MPMFDWGGGATRQHHDDSAVCHTCMMGSAIACRGNPQSHLRFKFERALTGADTLRVGSRFAACGLPGEPLMLVPVMLRELSACDITAARLEAPIGPTPVRPAGPLRGAGIVRGSEPVHGQFTSDLRAFRLRGSTALEPHNNNWHKDKRNLFCFSWNSRTFLNLED